MSDTKPNITSKKKKASLVNPFIQMIEDKKSIDQAIQDGKSPANVSDIKFVKSL